MFKELIYKNYLIFLIILLCQLEARSEETWELLFQPRQRVVRSIESYDEKLFTGTGNGVFLSDDGGENWHDFGTNQLQKDINGNSLINWIHVDGTNNLIYIATSNGAYSSYINEPNWKKLFENTKIESNSINSINVIEDKIYLATNDGLWICSDEKACTRLNNGLKPNSVSGNYEVSYVTKVSERIHLSTSNGIYVLNEEKLFWEDDSVGIQELPDGQINAKYILEDKEGNIWAACGSGVYLKNQELGYWEDISEGINKNNDGFREMFFLFEDNEYLYAASSTGIYSLDKERKIWEEISGGIRTSNNKTVYFLYKFKNKLFAATDEGLFLLEKKQEIRKQGDKEEENNSLVLKGTIEKDFADLDELEPNVVEVQKQAMKFASLPTSGDYKRYRLQARLRNFFPNIGFDANTTGTNTGYYETEKGISTNVSLNNSFDAGRTTRFQNDGRSFKQLSVQWNTNRFIYDDEINNILSQARLTTNIRENLLDDVTRIYYQRKKLLLEKLVNPQKDIETKLSNELAVNELTGQLDSRTGGWFSKEIASRKELRTKELRTKR